MLIDRKTISDEIRAKRKYRSKLKQELHDRYEQRTEYHIERIDKQIASLQARIERLRNTKSELIARHEYVTRHPDKVRQQILTTDSEILALEFVRGILRTQTSQVGKDARMTTEQRETTLSWLARLSRALRENDQDKVERLSVQLAQAIAEGQVTETNGTSEAK